ncbi:ABI-1-like 1 [Actinidia rufa]|uniref:ABI-1-like 1 n=1 Tax=Actinidia rufa TaxID=165716 RepID=A0A7J0DNA1_9ERIC|nr:ABI-1-like 1 [Actinidia rufa]
MALKQSSASMTFDEVSMERSKSFVKALQEFKNLRPQLYSAAEYCEKSYLHSEQKQMVLDNLKDYAVRALVNAVDHLGTVAYKLTDLLEQQTLDVSTMELKVSCLNQQLLTCKTYTDKEGLRQQQLLAFIPRHHKHYILPNSVNKKVHFSPQIRTDTRQSHVQTRPRLYPSGTPAPNTLSWHLASETKSTLKSVPRALISSEDPKTSGKASRCFHLVDAEESTRMKNPQLLIPSCLVEGMLQVQLCIHSLRHGGGDTKGRERSKLTWDITDSKEDSKPLTVFRSFNNPSPHELVRAPARSKSMLSAFFVKPKTSKVKTSS